MMDNSSDRPLNVVLFVDFDVRSSYPLYAQCVLRKLLDQGHHVALFAHYQEKPLLLLEEPAQTQSTDINNHHHHHTRNQPPGIVFQLRLARADAVLIITPRTVHELSFSLPRFQAGNNAFDGHTYTWHTNGISCVLLGGWINNRKVAMKVRAILASSDYPDMTRALPRPAYLDKFYVEDQSIETPGPCI
ncbi:uncharacterized protein LOC116308231 [Actinia tenebrosa]|uniref:Uncharacterized protein LOC116308231 n=1 Tax=Actinia tenebrosa TaxID=6105 RepID=A0A6P8JD79_ACTTE|nr:uncharacterized protein LOC116308231 [Actinia tenebrosa]